MLVAELAILSCERRNKIKMGKDRYFEVDRKEGTHACWAG